MRAATRNSSTAPAAFGEPRPSRATALIVSSQKAYGTQFLVGDDKEIAGFAGWVEDPDLRHAVAQIEEFAGIVISFLKPGARIVEGQRSEDSENIRHGGVVHAERAAFPVLRHGMDHRPEDVLVDLCPVEVAQLQKGKET